MNIPILPYHKGELRKFYACSADRRAGKLSEEYITYHRAMPLSHRFGPALEVINGERAWFRPSNPIAQLKRAV